MDKVERLVQLVTLLLGAKVPMPFADIQGHMSEFYDQSEGDAAKRMFERDKDELRGMGVPIELEPLDVLVEGEMGYRIHPKRYYLPEISFTPEEAAALTILAADPGEDDAALQGLRKVIYGVQGGPLASSGSVVAPGPDAVGGGLAPLVTAMAEGVAVRFAYRNAAGEASDRTVDPLGLVTRDGHWYLVARDRANDEIRAFRASRFDDVPSLTDSVAAQAPEGFDAASHVRGPWELETGEMATLAMEPSVAWWAQRSLRGASSSGERGDGWMLLQVPITGDLAGSILRFGSDAEVVAPANLRDEVIQRLTEEVQDAAS